MAGREVAQRDGVETHVLHVDDDEELLDVTAAALESRVDQLTVTTATSATDGLDVLARRDVDCIVSDYKMAEMDGLAFLDAVREDDEEIPFVLFTGHGSERIASEAISRGVSEYVEKTGDSEQFSVLANRVETLVDERRAERSARRTRDRLQRNAESLRRLYEISTDPDLDFETKLERVLETGANLLDVSVGYATTIDEGTQRVLAAAGDHALLTPGEESDLSNTYCRRVVDSEGPLVLEDAEREGWADDPAYETSGLRCYLGAPVVVDGDLYGTLCFGDAEPRERDVGDHERSLLSLLAQWAGYELAVGRADDDCGPWDEPPYAAVFAAATEHADSFESRLERVLTIGSEYLSASHGFLSNTQDDLQDIEVAIGDHPLLQSGESAPLDASYCQHTIQSDDVMTVDDAEREGWGDTVGYQAYRLGSYIGSRIEVDGRTYGTVCFSSYEAREEAFTEREKQFVDAIADWVEFELQRRAALSDAGDDRVEEVLGVLTHDLQNPLQVAEGNLQLLAEDVDDDRIESVRTAIERIGDIVDDVVTLAGAGDAETERVSLSAVATDAWATTATADADLSVEGDRELSANRSRLRQVFENLFRNAVEHGRTNVTVRVGHLDDGLFYVADDGPGIPESDREQVFEAGYSTAEEGTGFGLAIVREIAGNHGWRVTATESETGGARFEFRPEGKGT